MGFVRGLLLSAAGAGMAYLAFATARLIAFERRHLQTTAAVTGVTILKPLCGDEPRLFENLCSFCDQGHERLQILFGVRDRDDPAISVAKRVIERFPGRDIKLIVDGRVRCENLKIANVMNMMEHAEHDVIVMADSDTRVGPSYVGAIVASFDDPNVGVVSCLYRGVPGSGGVSELGALFINDLFAPSVLVALAMSPMDFAFGATIAMTRAALQRIGGFAAVGSYLADDRLLAERAHAAGLKVVLNRYVVEHDVREHDIEALWAHELRWARTMRSARPYGYAFSFIMYPLPFAFAAWMWSRGRFASLVLAAVILARIAMHVASRRALRVRTSDAPWLIPVRDGLGLALWATAFFGSGVRWGDSRFAIDAKGRILRSVS